MNVYRRRSVSKLTYQPDLSKMMTAGPSPTCGAPLARTDCPDAAAEGSHKFRDNLKTMFAHFNVHLPRTHIPEEHASVPKAPERRRKYSLDVTAARTAASPYASLRDTAKTPQPNTAEEHKPLYAQIYTAPKYRQVQGVSEEQNRAEHNNAHSSSPYLRPVTVEEELQHKLNKMSCMCNMWKLRWQAEREEKLNLLEEIKKTEESCVKLVEELTSSYSEKLSELQEEYTAAKGKIEGMEDERNALAQRIEFLNDHIDQLNDAIDTKSKTIENLNAQNQQLADSLAEALNSKDDTGKNSSQNSNYVQLILELALMKLNIHERKVSQTAERRRHDVAGGMTSRLYTVTATPGKPTEMSVQLVGNIINCDETNETSVNPQDITPTEKFHPAIKRTHSNPVPKRRCSSESEALRLSPRMREIRRVAYSRCQSSRPNDDITRKDKHVTLTHQNSFGSCSSLQSYSGSEDSDTSSVHNNDKCRSGYASDGGESVGDNRDRSEAGKVTNLQDSNFAGLRSRRNGICAIPSDVSAQFVKSKKNSSKELSEFLLRKLTMKKTHSNEDEIPVKKLKEKLKSKVTKNAKKNQEITTTS